MTILNKTGILKYIDEYNKDVKSMEELRTKLSLLFGYYAGQSMSATLDAENDNYTKLFRSQWKYFEPIMVQLNEVRPVDFELASSLAAKLLTARARLSAGRLTNLFLTSDELDVLDFKKTTERILGTPVTVSEMTLFFTTFNQLAH